MQAIRSGCTMLQGLLFDYDRCPKDDFDSRVARSVDKLQLDRARLLAVMAVHINALLAASNAVHCACGWGKENSTENTSHMRMRLIGNSTTLLVLEAVLAFPGLLTVKRLQVPGNQGLILGPPGL